MLALLLRDSHAPRSMITAWAHLKALFAANLNKVYSAVALNALEVYTITTPWLHQDTTTIALYGAYADRPKTPGAPVALAIAKTVVRSQTGAPQSRGQRRWRVPVRLGMRTATAVIVWETPVALRSVWRWAAREYAGCVASKAYSRRTLGLCLEHGLGLIPCSPADLCWSGRNSKPEDNSNPYYLS